MTAEQVRAQIADRFAAPAPSGPGWVDAETLLSGAGPLDALLDAQRRGGKATSEAAAGSLVVLEYTRLLAWPVLAAAVRDGTRLDHTPSNVVVRPGELVPGRLAFRHGPAPAGDPPLTETVGDLVEHHLARLVGAVRLRVRVGRRTLWSNVAAAVAGGLLALSWEHPPRDRHVELARAVLDGTPLLRELATPLAVCHDGAGWMVVWRRGCCLAFRRGSDAPTYCGTCPILDEAERLRRFRLAADRYLVLTGAAGESG